MVQASIKSEICLHKNSKRELKKEVYDNKIPDKEVAGQKVPGKKELDKEVPDQKVPDQKVPDKKESGKEVPDKEISCKIPLKKKLPKKKKLSLCITFHNPNSKEATASFLTKVLAERLAEEIGKGSCK